MFPAFIHFYVSFPDSCTWAKLKWQSSDCPSPRYCHSAVVHDRAMWVFGGLEGLQAKSDLWRISLGRKPLLCLCSGAFWRKLQGCGWGQLLKMVFFWDLLYNFYRRVCRVIHDAVQEVHSVLMLCAPSQRRRPFSYRIRMADECFVHFLVKKSRHNSAKCIGYGT